MVSWCSCSCLHPMRWQISCYLGQSEDRGCSIALHNSWLIYFVSPLYISLATLHADHADATLPLILRQSTGSRALNLNHEYFNLDMIWCDVTSLQYSDHRWRDIFTILYITRHGHWPQLWIINVCFPGWVSFSQSVTSLSACTRSLYQVYLLVPVSLSLSPQCAACPGVILHCCTWPPPRATLSRLLTPGQLTSPWLKNISYLKSWSKLTVKMN